MVTLGLDISTTCVGYAFTEDKKILDMGFIDIKKEKTPKDKVQKVLDLLMVAKWPQNIKTRQDIPLILKVKMDW